MITEMQMMRKDLTGWSVDSVGEKVNEIIRALNTTEAVNATTNVLCAQCKCAVKRTEVPGMSIIYAQRECPIHGHLHNAHC